MRTYGRVEANLHIFFTSAADEVECSACQDKSQAFDRGQCGSERRSRRRDQARLMTISSGNRTGIVWPIAYTFHVSTSPDTSVDLCKLHSVAPTVFTMKLQADIRTSLSLNLKVYDRKCQVHWGMLERT